MTENNPETVDLSEDFKTYVENYLKQTMNYLSGIQNAFDSYFKQIYPELNKEGKQERCNQGK